MNNFPNYKGKQPEDLRSVPQFAPHVTKLFNRMLDMLDIADDAGKLETESKKLVDEHTTRGTITAKDYEVGHSGLLVLFTRCRQNVNKNLGLIY